jgi:hypothetical protein
MPFRVVARGCVTEEPSRLLGEDSWVVLVLDPFPGSTGARLAHACEVVCRSQQLASSTVEGIQQGDRVVVTGELILERASKAPSKTISALSVRGSRRKT